MGGSPFIPYDNGLKSKTEVEKVPLAESAPAPLEPTKRILKQRVYHTMLTIII